MARMNLFWTLIGAVSALFLAAFAFGMESYFPSDTLLSPQRLAVLVFLVFLGGLIGFLTGKNMFLCNEAKRELEEVRDQARSQAQDQSFALSETRDRLGIVINNIPQFICWKDADLNYLGCNQNFARIAGVDEPAAIVGKTDSDLAWNPEDAEFFTQCDRQVLETGKPVHHVIELQMPDGKPHAWIDMKRVPLFDADNTVVGVLGTYEDISKRRQAVRALQVSEERYKSILENLEDGYFEVDLAGRFLFVNPALCQIYQRTRDELLGMSYREFTPKGGAEHVFKLFNQVFRTGEPVRITDYEIVRDKDEVRFVETSVALITDDEGLPQGFRGVMRDVTDRLEAEKEKKDLEDRLQQAQKMEAVGTLAGGIAHDFNNLLMGLQGNISLMLLGLDKAHAHHPRLKSMEEFVQGGVALTRQILGFARGGKYEVSPADLNEMVEKTSSLFSRTRKEISLSFRPAKDLWPVEVDRGQIEQVLLNLYVNAWQAMPGGGDLFINLENFHISPEDSAPMAAMPGRYVKCTVRDTGCGMDEETRKRAFDPFFTTKDRGRGTGLGLASAYGIINNHGGFMTLDSRPGQGTKACFFLPASRKRVVDDKDTTAELIRGQGLILLVEDEEAILETAREMLQNLGYVVLTATGAEQALKIFEKQNASIDLVILDMVMPGMGGSEAFDHLKAIRPDARVLLSSGYSLDGQATAIMEKGCDGFLQKPFDIGQLSRKIRDVLNG